MKIEIEGGAAPTVIICAIALMCIILGVSVMLTLMHCYEVRMYTTHGYTSITLPDASCVYWEKEVK